jgi:hypothetical protein
MSMTKKELAEMEALRGELALAKALRFTDMVPRDVAIPCNGLAKGWLPSGYGLTAEISCSSSTGHAFKRNDKTTTQGAVSQHSTELLALRACRNLVEHECARKLAQVDARIKAAGGGK